MTNRNCAIGLVLLTALAVAPALGAGDAASLSDHAANPEAIAKACMRHVEALAVRCINHNERTAKRCVHVIHLLLEAGEEEKARRVAHYCARDIIRTTNACVDEIEEACRRCVAALRQAGAGNELIARVKQFCRDAIAKVNKSKEAALQDIRRALEG